MLGIASEGTLSWTDVNPASPPPKVTFTFDGMATAVSWMYSMGPDGGQARVVIDGVTMGIFSTYAPEYRRQVLKTWKLPATTTAVHTLEIQALSGRIDVDAFMVDIGRLSGVAGTSVDANQGAFQYLLPQEWSAQSLGPGNAYFQTQTEGTVMRVTFETSAPSVALGLISAGDGGRVKVTLDGVDQGELGMYFPGYFIPTSYSFPLNTGHSIHTLHLTTASQPETGGVTTVYVDELFFHN